MLVMLPFQLLALPFRLLAPLPLLPLPFQLLALLLPILPLKARLFLPLLAPAVAQIHVAMLRGPPLKLGVEVDDEIANVKAKIQGSHGELRLGWRGEGSGVWRRTGETVFGWRCASGWGESAMARPSGP